MARVRDTQRGKVYKAEEHLPEALKGPKFETLADCQAYYDHITQSRWWKARAIETPIFLRDGRGTRTASAYSNWAGGYINLPRWSRYQIVMLHELAHILNNRSRQHGADRRPHGAGFVRAFLDLVGRWIGPNMARVLRESMLEHGVRIVNRKR
jgi:putative metallohydrolase (TIGR04338 family)